ncbi:MAG: glycosyltransferase [Candidatus Gracilibacteria bacterium]|nr:glycosyltransferase [Candidatus Gracilibacteria bacterium]
MKVLHISIFPPKGERHAETGGVASYTKNLITNIPYNESDNIFILCNKINGKKDSYYEDGINVIRCFDKNPFFFFQLIKQIIKIKPDIIHIQQELSLYGNIITAYILQWLILFMRKYKVLITLHGVVPIKKITKDFIKENNSKLPIWIVKTVFRIIYVPICLWAEKIIVHEKIFKNALIEDYKISKDKIDVINHGIEDLKLKNREESCKKLELDSNKDLVLFMGYATGYKGIDLLIDGFSEYSKINSNAFLIIGAGKHPKLFNDKAYLEEYERLQNKAESLIKENNFKWIGFIEEKSIVDYYSAADVSIYPYTIQMSSSGPMAISIGYNKPFLASDVFKESIDDNILLFERNSKSMSDKLDFFFKNREEYNDVIKNMREEKLWNKVGESTYYFYKN